MTVERAYKTLRNHLHKVETIEALYAIWAYSVNVTRGKPFPHDVIPAVGFPEADYIQKIRWTPPWDLEVLAREVIINSQLNLRSPKTLRDPNYFSGAFNKLKEIEGAISNEYITVENVMKEMSRISHRQFTWQVQVPNHTNIARYFRIFGHPEVSAAVELASGLSTQKIFGIGIILWGQFVEHFSVPTVKFDLPEIQQSDVEIFERHFAAEIEELRPILKGEVQVNEKFNYSFNSLRRYPVLKDSKSHKGLLLCPIPELIFRQITGGIYYLVKWTGVAGNALGKGFQKYIGDVMTASQITNRFVILPEDSFGKEEKNTVDWIMTNDESALFIECKTKRVTAITKQELLSDESANKDLDYLADAVVQVYKTMRDYIDGKYPSLKYTSDRKTYPVVVTMEDWFLMGEGLVTIRRKTQEKMRAEALPEAWIEEMPFSIMSANEFEMLLRILPCEPVPEIIEGKQKDKEMHQWAYASYFHNKHQKYLNGDDDFFPDIFKEILPLSYGKNQDIKH